MRNPIDRRRERMQEEFRRNRAGDHAVPTWLLAVLLGLFLAGWAAVVLIS